MSMVNKTAATLAVGTAIMVTVAVYAAKRKSETEAERMALIHNPANAASVQRLKQSIAIAHEERKQLEQAQQKLRSGPKWQPYRRPPSEQSLVRDDPKLQVLYLQAVRARSARQYGPLLSALGLSSEQRKRFLDLLVQHAEDRLDLVNDVNGASEPITGDVAATATLVQQESAQFKSSLEGLLGDAGYQKKMAYDQTLGARELVNSYAGLTAFTDPTNAGQAEALVQLLANSSPQFRSGLTFTTHSADFDQATQQAAQLLTPTQLLAWNRALELPRAEAKFAAAIGAAVKAFRTSEGKSGPNEQN
jgi:hypothetical protein